MEQQEKNEWAQQEQEIQEGLKGKSFWYADWGFPILVGIMSAAIFAGTHMYVVYGCLLYTSPSPRDRTRSRMPSSA